MTQRAIDARDILDSIIDDITYSKGSTPDSAIERIDNFTATIVAVEFQSFATELLTIAQNEGFNADPARRKAFAEIIALAKTRTIGS